MRLQNTSGWWFLYQLNNRWNIPLRISTWLSVHRN